VECPGDRPAQRRSTESVEQQVGTDIDSGQPHDGGTEEGQRPYAGGRTRRTPPRRAPWTRLHDLRRTRPTRCRPRARSPGRNTNRRPRPTTRLTPFPGVGGQPRRGDRCVRRAIATKPTDRSRRWIFATRLEQGSPEHVADALPINNHADHGQQNCDTDNNSGDPLTDAVRVSSLTSIGSVHSAVSLSGPFQPRSSCFRTRSVRASVSPLSRPGSFGQIWVPLPPRSTACFSSQRRGPFFATRPSFGIPTKLALTFGSTVATINDPVGEQSRQ
jgi:hypothetical protein